MKDDNKRLKIRWVALGAGNIARKFTHGLKGSNGSELYSKPGILDEHVDLLKNMVYLKLMEAMWTRYLPIMYKVREWVSSEAIGEVRLMTADFGFRTSINAEGRLFDLELGGGALLDVGVYVVNLASMIFGGTPNRITGMAHIGETGVDEQSAMILGYKNGELAVLHTAIRTNTHHEARIIGTKGSIVIPNFWRASSATLQVDGKEKEIIEIP